MIEADSLQELAAAYPAIAALPSPLSDLVRRSAARASVPAGHHLFDDEGPCHGLALPVSGCVRVAKMSPEGRGLLLYRVRPGELCVLTLGCLLGHTHYNATGVVEADLVGYVLPPPAFVQLIGADPGFRDMVLASFARRLADTMALVEAVTFQRLDERLAGLLLERGDDIQVTHQQLADDLGSVREIVSRLLEGFRDEGLVVLARGHITITDRPRLSRLAAPRA